MTWHVVKIKYEDREDVSDWVKSRKVMWAARRWCADSLSSNGVLWKHEFGGKDWQTFYFAQPQDVLIFKLMFA